jgi:hypothetical protein
MQRVGFERTIQVFGRAKTLHILDRAATVIGSFMIRSVVHYQSTVNYNIIS